VGAVEIKNIDTPSGRRRMVTKIIGKTNPDFESKREKRYTVAEITPDAAAALLRLVDRQRPLNAGSVSRYARAMTEKQWRWTPQSSTLTLSKDYHLIDAQHRLHAVVKSGIPLKDVTICVVASDDVAPAIDIDILKRSARDNLRFITGRTIDVRAISAIVFEATNFATTRGIIQDTDRVTICSNYDLLDEAITLASWSFRMRTGSGIIAGALRCVRVYGDEAMTFFSKVFMNEHIINGMFSDSAKRLSDYMIANLQHGTETTKTWSASGYPSQKQNAEVAMHLFVRWLNGDEGKYKIPSLATFQDKKNPRDVKVPEELLTATPVLQWLPQFNERLYTK
jgi:hypothetical protein